MTKPIRILIADHHDVFREGLAALVCSRQDMEVVALASNGREQPRAFESISLTMTVTKLKKWNDTSRPKKASLRK